MSTGRWPDLSIPCVGLRSAQRISLSVFPPSCGIEAESFLGHGPLRGWIELGTFVGQTAMLKPFELGRDGRLNGGSGSDSGRPLTSRSTRRLAVERVNPFPRLVRPKLEDSRSEAR
jgi:hypothetical protein